ncbi:hypothetical protein FIBSPDRAFT_898719 [Athelia psychrophila]|uniref:Uncharacterized protein n=1 Tax=Athelia psychrophila TaxID=1759441 RepID=A0A166APM3_9AGAM|nr:hypothetical protein FIBSPDRAFT_898719 [Fibularhizoctonia sp. CBS 109695]
MGMGLSSRVVNPSTVTRLPSPYCKWYSDPLFCFDSPTSSYVLPVAVDSFIATVGGPCTASELVERALAILRPAPLFQKPLFCLDFYFNQSWGVLACQYYELRAPARVKFVFQSEDEYPLESHPSEMLDWSIDIPGLFRPRRHRKVTLPIFNPPQGIPSPALILRALNAPVSPGLSIEQILELIVECDCGMVVSRECFHAHICLSRERGATVFSEPEYHSFEEESV